MKGLIITVISIFMVILPYVSFCACLDRMLFRRKEATDIEGLTACGTHYHLHRDKMISSYNRLKSMRSSEISVLSYDGLRLVAEVFEAEAPIGRVVLFFHGYHSSPIYNFSTQICDFHDRGWDVISVYERVHGKSEGKIITFGNAESDDCILWIKKASEVFPGKRILLYGASMGGAAVCRAAEKGLPESVACIVSDSGLVSTHDTLYKVAHDRIRIPAKLYLPVIITYNRLVHKTDIDMINSARSLEKCNVPVFFFSAGKDSMLFPEETKRCYDAVKTKKMLIFEPDEGHTATYLCESGVPKARMFEFVDSVFAE